MKNLASMKICLGVEKGACKVKLSWPRTISVADTCSFYFKLGKLLHAIKLCDTIYACSDLVLFEFCATLRFNAFRQNNIYQRDANLALPSMVFFYTYSNSRYGC